MVEQYAPDAPLARFIDHTLLKPAAAEKDIVKLCEEAARHGFYSVCVNGSWVPLCRELLEGTGVRISAVAGFPLGAMATRVKAIEAANAVEDGASEIDMVLPVGALADGRFGIVAYDISAVARAVEGHAIVKVILETGLLTDTLKAEACRVAEAAGAHYVKTSTGFGPGGATEADIKLMRGSVSPGIGVKASGGIRDAETAIRLLTSGANRLGTSAGIAIVSAATDGAASGDSRPEGQAGSTQY